MVEKKFKEYVYKYMDKELSDEEANEFEQYLEGDPLAKLELEKEQRLDHFLKTHMVKEEAPYELRERVVADLERAAGERPAWNFGAWLKPVGVSLLSFMFIFTILLRPTESFPVLEASVDSHMEVLNGAYPMEIKSNNAQEIATWFEGKLDTAVMVPDFSKHGCELKGARICHLKDRKVALLSYEKEGHKMTVFVVAFEDAEAPKAKEVKQGEKNLFVKKMNGFNSVLCLSPKHAGIGCVFVSDMPEEELLDLIG